MNTQNYYEIVRPWQEYVVPFSFGFCLVCIGIALLTLAASIPYMIKTDRLYKLQNDVSSSGEIE